MREAIAWIDERARLEMVGAHIPLAERLAKLNDIDASIRE
jgi:hypothetical protein